MPLLQDPDDSFASSERPYLLSLFLCHENKHHFSLAMTSETSNPLQNLFYHHRAAIALNNIGVALSERFSPREAYIAIKDAVYVMKAIFLHIERGEPLPEEEDVAGRLARSNANMARIANSPRTMTERGLVVIHGQSEVLSVSIDIPSVISEAARDNVFFLLTIENGLLDSLYDHSVMEIQSLIILNNFAVANSILLKRTDKEPDSDHLLENAFSLFSYTYTILKNNPNLFNSKHYPSVVAISIAMLILSNFTVVLTAQGRFNDVQRLKQKIVQLDNAKNERLVAAFPINEYCVAPAA